MTTAVQATQVAPPKRAPRSRPFAAVLAAVGIPMFMVTLDNLVVTNALPVIKSDMGASLSDLQWVVNAYTLSFASLLLTASAIGDRIGRRRTFIAGIGLFTLASLLCGLAAEPWQLITARAFQGLGGAMVMPLSLTLLADAVPAKMRNAAIGIWGGISGLGVAAGPVVGGAVAEGLDWHWIFWLNVPVGLVAIPLAAWVLNDSRGGFAKFDPLGLLLSSAGVFASVWGIVHGADDGWTSVSVLGSLIAGAVLLIAFVAWERRASSPMLPMHLFGSRSFSLVNAISFTFALGAFGSVFLLAQFFQVVQGMNPLQAGLRTMPWTMAPMVFAPLAGILVGRVGARTLIFLGQSFLAVALAWISLRTAADTSYGSLVVPFLLAGAGMGLALTPTAATVIGSVRQEQTGVASGTNNTVREIGVAMGVAVLSSVFAAYGSYVNPQSYVDGLAPAVMVGAVVVGIGALLALLLPGRRSMEVFQ